MRWKAETQGRINGILGLKHNVLTKIHEHGVISHDVQELCRSDHNSMRPVAPGCPPIGRNLSLNASMRTAAREHTKAGRRFGIAS